MKLVYRIDYTHEGPIIMKRLEYRELYIHEAPIMTRD